MGIEGPLSHLAVTAPPEGEPFGWWGHGRALLAPTGGAAASSPLSHSGPRNPQGKRSGEFAMACFRIYAEIQSKPEQAEPPNRGRATELPRIRGGPGGIARFAIPPGGFPPISTRESGSQAAGRGELQVNGRALLAPTPRQDTRLREGQGPPLRVGRQPPHKKGCRIPRQPSCHSAGVSTAVIVGISTPDLASMSRTK